MYVQVPTLDPCKVSLKALVTQLFLSSGSINYGFRDLGSRLEVPHTNSEVGIHTSHTGMSPLSPSPPKPLPSRCEDSMVCHKAQDFKASSWELKRHPVCTFLFTSLENARLSVLEFSVLEHVVVSNLCMLQVQWSADSEDCLDKLP